MGLAAGQAGTPARLPDAAVSTLAGYTVDGQQFCLVSYRDSAGGKCVAIDRAWQGNVVGQT